VKKTGTQNDFFTLVALFGFMGFLKLASFWIFFLQKEQKM
jgi:hypothetical protein